MGNSLLKCFGCGESKTQYASTPVDTGESKTQYASTPVAAGESKTQYASTPVATAATGVDALVLDLRVFAATSQVPKGLNRHVRYSEQEQAIWYKKILQAWRTYQPPKTPKEATKLIFIALRENQPADVQSLLAYYGLPFPSTYDVSSVPIPPSVPLPPPPLPKGVQFVLRTLPVNERHVGDGDGFTAYVKPEELPTDIRNVALQMESAQSAGKHSEAKKAEKCLCDQGYEFIMNSDGYKILARKDRFRLRGIDAPEIGMPYAEEARDELRNLVGGKCLKISVYDTDRYDRYVGDVHCDGVFAQEQMLKQGLAWHYAAFDQREDFARWEKEARNARRGLWALTNPEAPWDWKRKNRQRKMKKQSNPNTQKQNPNPEAPMQTKKQSNPNPEAPMQRKRHSNPNPEAPMQRKKHSNPNPEAPMQRKKQSNPNPRKHNPNPEAPMQRKKQSNPNPQKHNQNPEVPMQRKKQSNPNPQRKKHNRKYPKGSITGGVSVTVAVH